MCKVWGYCTEQNQTESLLPKSSQSSRSTGTNASTKHSSHQGGRDRIPRDAGNGAEPQLRSSPGGGGGEAHSKQRELHRSKQVLKAHAMLQ